MTVKARIIGLKAGQPQQCSRFLPLVFCKVYRGLSLAVFREESRGLSQAHFRKDSPGRSLAHFHKDSTSPSLALFRKGSPGLSLSIKAAPPHQALTPDKAPLPELSPDNLHQ